MLSPTRQASPIALILAGWRRRARPSRPGTCSTALRSNQSASCSRLRPARHMLFLFKLLANPGESVLVPSPSYPLFEHLARVEGIEAIPYHLNPEFDWRPDLPPTSRPPVRSPGRHRRAPNNPTGSLIHPDDASALATSPPRGVGDRGRRGVPRLLPRRTAGRRRHLWRDRAGAHFSLGGLSKSVGLPQLKLAWLVASGPGDLVKAALERLEFIADTFLSVSTPVQLALPLLLREVRWCAARSGNVPLQPHHAPAGSVARPHGRRAGTGGGGAPCWRFRRSSPRRISSSSCSKRTASPSTRATSLTSRWTASSCQLAAGSCSLRRGGGTFPRSDRDAPHALDGICPCRVKRGPFRACRGRRGRSRGADGSSARYVGIGHLPVPSPNFGPRHRTCKRPGACTLLSFETGTGDR